MWIITWDQVSCLFVSCKNGKKVKEVKTHESGPLILSLSPSPLVGASMLCCLACAPSPPQTGQPDPLCHCPMDQQEGWGSDGYTSGTPSKKVLTEEIIWVKVVVIVDAIEPAGRGIGAKGEIER